MHNISGRVNRYCNSVSQKYKATASVLNAPQGSISVKVLPYLVDFENSVKKAGNKVTTVKQDFLSTLSEPTGALPKSNNCNPYNNDIDNNNPTNTKAKGDDWDHCESLVAEHNTVKQATENIKNAFGEHSEIQTPDYYYDASTANNYVLQPIEDAWTYIE